MPETLRSGRLDVPGGSLYFEVAGRGSPLVLVHAAIADRRMWDREFAEYSKRHTVVRYDVRGFGKSPPATALYSDSDDLERLLEHLRLGAVTLAGCSNGGRIALDLAVEHPSSVRALLLAAPGVSGFTEELDPGVASVSRLDAARMNEIREMWAAGRRDEALERLRIYWCSQVRGAQLELVRSMMRANAREIFEDVSARHATSPEPPAAARLQFIRVPTRILQGDHDEPTMTFITRWIARQIPEARYLPVTGADHLINLSRPREFDAVLGDLLR